MNKEFLKFLLVGGFNTLLTYILYLIAILFVPYQVAYVLSYCFGLLLVSILNVKFVYGQPISFKNIMKTIFVYLIQFAIGFILITACVGYLGIDKRIAPLIIIIFSIPVTFFANKFVLQKNKNWQ
jgi:putative flippase GtrA